jgi:catechol 2,3-dioxygenase-like lactoylglutathione lyase family enzyme
MIDHLGIQVADVDASVQFYSGVFAALGLAEGARFPTENGPVVGFTDSAGTMSFWLSPNVGGGPSREDHIAFAADSREQVDAVHTAAVAAGIEVLHQPKEWPEYHPGYYAVFLRDPDGHNIEAVVHH